MPQTVRGESSFLTSATARAGQIDPNRRIQRIVASVRKFEPTAFIVHAREHTEDSKLAVFVIEAANAVNVWRLYYSIDDLWVRACVVAVLNDAV